MPAVFFVFGWLLGKTVEQALMKPAGDPVRLIVCCVAGRMGQVSRLPHGALGGSFGLPILTARSAPVLLAAVRLGHALIVGSPARANMAQLGAPGLLASVGDRGALAQVTTRPPQAPLSPAATTPGGRTRARLLGQPMKAAKW
jgi:hypothetical protein